MMDEMAPPGYDTAIKGSPYQGGYDGNGFFDSNEGVVSPPTAPPYEPPQHQNRLEINLGVLSDDDIREACLDYTADHCCYGKRFVRDADFPNIYNGYTFHYKLETYGEKRQTTDQSVPYTGQFIDGPEHGLMPNPWDITVSAPPVFRDGQVKVEIPHSAVVKECFRCVGNCRVRCDSCSGMGGNSCYSCFSTGRRDGRMCTMCNGTGRQLCWSCSGTGQVKCGTCNGRGRLKHYKLLIVTWKNHIANFVANSYNLPKSLILEVSGREMFQEEGPQVYPITHVDDESVKAESINLIENHKINFTHELIRKQRHTLYAVPITKVSYAWRNKPGEFFVYGFQKKVYFENYPQKCCCCTIL